jgi:hypothetical protein
VCRIEHPENYDAEKYFQRSWSGAELKNGEWVKKFEKL